MRRVLLYASFVVLALVSTPSYTVAGDSEGLRFGPYFGPSFPSESFANVYNVATGEGTNSAYDFASGLGFHIGGRIRYGLAENFSLSGGIAYHRFPNLDLVFSSDSGAKLSIKNVSNIIPINVGVLFRLPLALIEPYVGVGALYVHQNTTLSEGGGVFSQVFSSGQQIETTTSRGGADITVGIGLNLLIFSPFIELRQTWSNLIGKEENEQSKSFMSISVGLLF